MLKQSSLNYIKENFPGESNYLFLVEKCEELVARIKPVVKDDHGDATALLIDLILSRLEVNNKVSDESEEAQFKTAFMNKITEALDFVLKNEFLNEDSK